MPYFNLATKGSGLIVAVGWSGDWKASFELNSGGRVRITVGLKLVDVLSDHDEVCVCDLNESIGSDMSTISRHLAQLKNAGIVESEQGQMVFYRLRVKCLTNLFGCIESVVKCQVDDQLKVLSQ